LQGGWTEKRKDAAVPSVTTPRMIEAATVSRLRSSAPASQISLG
jgi:hypothetical protein